MDNGGQFSWLAKRREDDADLVDKLVVVAKQMLTDATDNAMQWKREFPTDHQNVAKTKVMPTVLNQYIEQC